MLGEAVKELIEGAATATGAEHPPVYIIALVQLFFV